jgi:hypothetical protein
MYEPFSCHTHHVDILGLLKSSGTRTAISANKHHNKVTKAPFGIPNLKLNFILIIII